MAGNNRFCYDKVVRDCASLAPIISTDYHPSYPPENVRNIWTDYPYRSKYASGGGYFEITSSNNKLYFVDNGSTARTATITTGTYDAEGLIAEIETQMEAQTTDTFTNSYSHTSFKFTITDDAGTFQLTCTNTTNAIWETIGFDTAADKTGAASYNSDDPRIHTNAALVSNCDGGASISATFAYAAGLNLTSTYQTLKLQRYAASSWNDVGDMTYDATLGIAYLAFSSVGGTAWRLLIKDKENPDGYVEVGVFLVGDYYTISKWFEYGASEDIEDTSTHDYSKQGYINVITGYFLETFGVTYELMTTDEGYLVYMYKEGGKKYPFVFVRDSDAALNTSQYVMFNGRLGRRVQDAYTKEITLTWVKIK